MLVCPISFEDNINGQLHFEIKYGGPFKRLDGEYPTICSSQGEETRIKLKTPNLLHQHSKQSKTSYPALELEEVLQILIILLSVVDPRIDGL